MGSYIEVKNVSKSFGHRPVLQNVSLTADRGKTVGLVGENGSGKSVLFKILCGFEKPDKGSVFVAGRRLEKMGVISLTIWGCSSMPRFYRYLQWFSEPEISYGHTKEDRREGDSGCHEQGRA
ncbi:MAG: ATP-binding cassette domain-containing protein [Blautia marasmi]